MKSFTMGQSWKRPLKAILAVGPNVIDHDYVIQGGFFMLFSYS